MPKSLTDNYWVESVNLVQKKSGPRTSHSLKINQGAIGSVLAHWLDAIAVSSTQPSYDIAMASPEMSHGYPPYRFVVSGR